MGAEIGVPLDEIFANRVLQIVVRWAGKCVAPFSVGLSYPTLSVCF